MGSDDGEQLLIKRAAAGGGQDFERLMTPYIEVLFRYIRTHIYADEDAKDVLQEAMLSIWQGLHSYSGGSSFLTWCIAVARRKTADFYRRRYKHGSAYFEETDIPLDCGFARLSDESIDVSTALDTLKSAEKELVFLIFSAGLTYTETAHIMNIPVGTVKSRMSGIRSKLKQKLGGGKEVGM